MQNFQYPVDSKQYSVISKKNTTNRLPITDYGLHTTGFTLAEMLVVLLIISILLLISLFALTGLRKSSRDTRRQGDLQQIRSALEFYRSDCSKYPTSLPAAGQPLRGDDSSGSCDDANEYLSAMPIDPVNSEYSYYYNRTSTTKYYLCAHLEMGTATDTICGNNCGISSVAQPCRLRVTGP